MTNFIEGLEGSSNHCAHLMNIVDFGKILIITGGLRTPIDTKSMYFLDSYYRPVEFKQVIGSMIPDMTQHVMFSLEGQEHENETFVMSGIIDTQIESRIFRTVIHNVPFPQDVLMIDQENAIVDRLNSFLSVFLDLPPPSTIRPRIYLSFLENTVNKYEMATTGNAPDDSVTHLHIFMEKLLMPCLSLLMWEAAYSKEVEDQDRIMSEKCRILKTFLTPAHIDIDTSKVNGAPWKNAQTALACISESSGAIEKIAHIMRCCSLIHDTLGWPAGADDFLPVLVYVTIFAGVENIHQELTYILSCSPQQLVSSGEEAYYITQLSCAVTFITSMSRESLRMDGAEFDRLLGHIISEAADDDEIHGEISSYRISQNMKRAESSIEESGKEWWRPWLEVGPDMSYNAWHIENLKRPHVPRKVFRCGFVEKQGFYNRSWKTRWLALYDHELEYFENQKDLTARGGVILNKEASIREYGPTSKIFEVCVPGRIYKFQAGDVATCQAWVADIKKHSEVQVLKLDDPTSKKIPRSTSGFLSNILTRQKE